MGDDADAGIHAEVERTRELTTDEGTAHVRVAAELVSEASEMLDTLKDLVARQSEKLSAAQRLLDEFDYARAEHDEHVRIARAKAPEDS